MYAYVFGIEPWIWVERRVLSALIDILFLNQLTILLFSCMKSLNSFYLIAGKDVEFHVRLVKTLW